MPRREVEVWVWGCLLALWAGAAFGVLFAGLSWLSGGKVPAVGLLPTLLSFALGGGIIGLVSFILAKLFHATRPSQTIPVSQEQRDAIWREAKVPAAIGAGIGIVLALGAVWLQLLPSDRGWQDVLQYACGGFGLGGYLGIRPIALKYGPSLGLAADNLWDAAGMGGIVGAAVVAIAVTAWTLVVRGTYDSAATLAAAGLGVGLGVPVNVWRRCIQFQRFPRTRVLLGALLSALAGAAFLWGIIFGSAWSQQQQLVAFWTDVGSTLRSVSADKWFGVRAITLVGALFGLITYLWWQFGRKGSQSPRIRWSAAGPAFDAMVDTAPKLGAFMRGLIWIVLAVVIWQAGSWWWAHFAAPGTIWEATGYVTYGGAAVALWKGLVELRTALKGSPTLQNEGVHGNARDATPDEAQQAASGVGRQPSLDDRRFRA